MRLGIRSKLFVLSLAFVAVIGVVVGVVLDGQLRESLESRISQELLRTVHTARVAIELSGAEPSVEALDPVADRLGASMDARVTIIAADGVVLGDSVLSAQRVRDLDLHASRPEIVEARERGEGRAARFSLTLNANMTYVAIPLRDPQGFVRVAVPSDEIADSLGQLRRTLVITGIVALAAAAVLAAFASLLLTRSLLALVAGARAIATNRAEVTRLPERQSDELGGLAGSFNAVVEDLEHAMTTLAHERNRFETVLDTMDTAVLALNDQRQLTLINRCARRMFGLPEQAIGKPLLDYVRAPELRELVAAAERTNTAHTEFEYGSMPRRSVTAHGTVQREGGMVLVLHDVTEVRRLETIRKDFVANVSHELRTPVSVIRANTETLLGGALQRPDQAVPFVEALHRHAVRLGRLVADLLDISRIEAGHFPIALEATSLGAAIDRAITTLATEAEDRGTRVRRGFEGELWVDADEKALDQVLVNLISNAIRYSHNGAEVEISVANAEADPLRIEVRDTGPGIDPKHHRRVFERFYRVDSGRSRDAGGTGLGLAIVKHLVEAMGGRVGVDTRRPWATVFWFTLARLGGRRLP